MYSNIHFTGNGKILLLPYIKTNPTPITMYDKFFSSFLFNYSSRDTAHLRQPERAFFSDSVTRQIMPPRPSYLDLKLKRWQIFTYLNRKNRSVDCHLLALHGPLAFKL
jgi:hypothetical protein